MVELENNYGVYLDIDNIYNEIKKQLKEIKCYKELFEYIGSEFGANMDDIDIIKESYKKAKRIGLIKYNQINENEEINYRRGRGKGRGRGWR